MFPDRPLASFALIPLSLVVLALGLEVALQLGAVVVGAREGDAAASWATGDRRVLCIGDSNTYGIRLEDRAREAYPGQLEALWNEASPESKIEVVNLGYPGTNSSVLLRNLPSMLESLEPQLVIVMVGVNDAWTEPVEIAADPRPGPLRWLRRHSRLYRGLFMLRRQLDPTEIEFEQITREENFGARIGVARYGDTEFRLGYTRAEYIDTPWEDLRNNLKTLAEIVADSRAELLLMTYPARFDYYGRANEMIRAAATSTGAALVDLEATFTPLCPVAECPDWLFEDLHPRPQGYRVMAETIVKRLEAGLD